MDFQFLNETVSEKELIRKKRSWKRKLLKQNPPKLKKKLYILSGSTIGEIADQIELFCLRFGIKLEIKYGDYARFFEEAVFDSENIKAFQPDYIYIHTSNKNIQNWPKPCESKEQVDVKADLDFKRYKMVLDSLLNIFSCPIIQNNFELLPYRILGNKDLLEPSGKNHYIDLLNHKLYDYVQNKDGVYINDINYLSAYMGIQNWYDPDFWYRYKYALSLDAIPYLAHNLSLIIKSLCGLNHKVLALDLDNTLWGGVVGDDGVDALHIGSETALGEAFSDFQTYLDDLKKLGIVLTVVSKNEEDIAKKAFSRKEMILSLEDFPEFKANWEAKSSNIKEIAKNLNLGLDSFVFVDDNPAERQEVKMNAPVVAVPEISQPEQYIFDLDFHGYFEITNFTAEDTKRTDYYKQNKLREEEQANYTDYNDYLNSLQMKWEFTDFDPAAIERITQLINKTNQFNLTTARMGFNEVKEKMLADDYLCLQGTMEDKFGDNGIVTLLIGKIVENTLQIDLWVMSCRVFKRNGEYKLFDYLVTRCKEKGISQIRGTYIPTAKNAIVKDFYETLGFRLTKTNENNSTEWEKNL